MKPERIIWHHSADPATIPQFAKIDRYHKSRTFPISSMGYYVGYHWVVERDGTVKQAREENEIGAHDTGENLNSIGICLAGDFNVHTPTLEQTAAAARLLGEIRARWSIPITRIEPHRWDDQTDCPGRLLGDNWLTEQYLQREVNGIAKAFLWIGKYYGWL